MSRRAFIQPIYLRSYLRGSYILPQYCHGKSPEDQNRLDGGSERANQNFSDGQGNDIKTGHY